MTKVLWLSRHIMSAEQVADLKRIYGKAIVENRADMTVSSWRDVVDAGADCDILAAGLPPAILADLTNPRNNSKPVIRAKANRVATGKTIVNPATGKEEAEYCFQHAGLEHVIKGELVSNQLLAFIKSDRYYFGVSICFFV